MRSAALVSISVLIVEVPGPFDHGLRRAIEEDELGVKLLLQLQLSSLTHLEHRVSMEEKEGKEKMRNGSSQLMMSWRR